MAYLNCQIQILILIPIRTANQMVLKMYNDNEERVGSNLERWGLNSPETLVEGELQLTLRGLSQLTPISFNSTKLLLAKK